MTEKQASLPAVSEATGPGAVAAAGRDAAEASKRGAQTQPIDSGDAKGTASNKDTAEEAALARESVTRQRAEKVVDETEALLAELARNNSGVAKVLLADRAKDKETDPDQGDESDQTNLTDLNTVDRSDVFSNFTAQSGLTGLAFATPASLYASAPALGAKKRVSGISSLRGSSAYARLEQRYRSVEAQLAKEKKNLRDMKQKHVMADLEKAQHRATELRLEEEYRKKIEVNRIMYENKVRQAVLKVAKEAAAAKRLYRRDSNYRPARIELF